MLSWNAVLFIAAQFFSRFANSFLTTAVRFELLESSGIAKFASAQVANQVARVFMQQLAGIMTDNYSLKRLYVLGEACNLLLVVVFVPVMLGVIEPGVVLFAVNVGLGLTQAFSAPVAKSLPPAVVLPDDLAIVNSWDLTGDKIGRNLAPMVFTVVSSSMGFNAAICFSLVLYLALVGMKQALVVADQQVQRKEKDGEAKTVATRLFTVFRQVRDGMLTLKSDRIIGLLILNTLTTNMIVYPLGSLVFPVIFKAIPEGAIEEEGSLISQFLLAVQSMVGINKKKAWMNYAALVSLGAVIGPFLSNIVVYRIKALAAAHPERVNWIGLNVGIIGQLVTMVPLLVVLTFLPSCSAGMRVFLLFLAWGAMNALNNVTTIYFNAHSQHRLDRTERGRFIANILTLFTLANSVGSLLYGWALTSESAEEQVTTSTRILSMAVVMRVGIIVMLRSDSAGVASVMLAKTDKDKDR